MTGNREHFICIKTWEPKSSDKFFHFHLQIFISHPHLSLKHACGNHPFYFMIFLWPREGYKNDSAIISIHSPNRGALEYPQKHALILHVQKLYQVRPANSTRNNYLGLVQFDQVDTHFYSKWGLLLVFFGLHVVNQVDKGIYTIHPRVVRFLLDMFCLVEGCLV